MKKKIIIAIIIRKKKMKILNDEIFQYISYNTLNFK